VEGTEVTAGSLGGLERFTERADGFDGPVVRAGPLSIARASTIWVRGFATNGTSSVDLTWTECEMKKLVGVIVIAFAVFFLLTQPQAAADAVRGAGGVVLDAFNAVITFISALFR
jgi:hypothetical protein